MMTITNQPLTARMLKFFLCSFAGIVKSNSFPFNFLNLCYIDLVKLGMSFQLLRLLEGFAAFPILFIYLFLSKSMEGRLGNERSDDRLLCCGSTVNVLLVVVRLGEQGYIVRVTCLGEENMYACRDCGRS